MLTFLVMVAVLALCMMFLAHCLGRMENPAAHPPIEEVTALEQTGLGDPEWGVVMRDQCLPLDCPNLKGSARVPGKEPGCQVCAALFLERYGERLLKQHREGRNR